MELTFHVYGQPRAKGSTRAFLPKGSKHPIVTADNPKTKDWERAIAEAARRQKELRGYPLEEEKSVAIYLRFYLSRPKRIKDQMPDHTTKPDLDKLVRAALDALTFILFRDDGQVSAITARKFYHLPGEGPGVTISVVCPPLRV